MVCTPPSTHKYLFVGAKFFSCLVVRSWQNFKFLGGLLYRVDLTPFGRGEAWPVSSIKPSMTNHVNSRIFDDKIICVMCLCKLVSLLLENFLFENFLCDRLFV